MTYQTINTNFCTFGLLLNLQDAPPNHAAHVAVKWEAPKRVWTSGAQEELRCETDGSNGEFASRRCDRSFQIMMLGGAVGDIFVGKFVKIHHLYFERNRSYYGGMIYFFPRIFSGGRMSIFQSCLFGQGFFLLQWCSLPSGQSSWRAQISKSEAMSVERFPIIFLIRLFKGHVKKNI